MLKIKDNDFEKWKLLGYKKDEDTGYYESSYFKDLYCYYNEVNPNLGFGTLFTDGEKLHFYKSRNFTNEFVNKDNFMQKIVDEEIDDLIQAGLVEKVKENKDA